jgi:hypothetical protein
MPGFRKIEPKKPKEIKEDMVEKENWPRFHIGLEHLPEAKKWDIGKKYRISLEVEMTGLNVSDNYSDASFDIKAIKIESKVKNMSKKEFEKHQADVMSGK